MLNGLLSIPLQMTAGVVLASNLLLLSSYAVAGFGMYLLALDVLPAHWRRTGRSRLPGGLRGRARLCLRADQDDLCQSRPVQYDQHAMDSVLRAVHAAPVPAPVRNRPQPDGCSDLPLPTAVAGTTPCSLRSSCCCTAYAEFTFASFLVLFFAGYLLYLALRRRRLLEPAAAGACAAPGGGLRRRPVADPQLDAARDARRRRLLAGGRLGFCRHLRRRCAGLLHAQPSAPALRRSGAAASALPSATPILPRSGCGPAAGSGRVVVATAVSSAGLPTAAFWGLDRRCSIRCAVAGAGVCTSLAAGCSIWMALPSVYRCRSLYYTTCPSSRQTVTPAACRCW